MSFEGETGEWQFKTAFCPDYEELLVKSHECLEKWEALRQEARHLGSRGKELDGDLIRLQSEFARSYSALQKHLRECTLCAFVANVGKQNIRNRFPIASGFSRSA